MIETIISKECTKCKEIKLLSEFFKECAKKTGHRSNCKVCDRNRTQTPKAKIYHNCYQKRYNQTQKGKSIRCLASRNHRINNPKKAKARSTIGHAKFTGKLLPATSMQCSFCNEQAEQYHHYLGYEPEYQLDVQPVCKKCHYKIHSLFL